MHLDRIVATATARGKSVAMTPEALDAIVREGYSMAYGARFLKRVIDDLVKIPLSQVWSAADRFTVARCRARSSLGTGRRDCDERGGVADRGRDSRSANDSPAITRGAPVRRRVQGCLTAWRVAMP